MKLTETTVEKNTVYSGKILNLRVDKAKLENGKTVTREMIEHRGGVTVAVLTDSDELLFVRQFRYPYGKVVLELPAGKLEQGEDPFEAMKREQKEETGTTSDEYVYLGDLYPSPGYTDEVLRIWGCRVSGYGKMNLDDDEFLEVEKIPLETAVKMVMNNELPDAKTQIGVLKAYEMVKNGKL